MNIVKLERSLRSVQFYESVRRLSTVSQQIQNQVTLQYKYKILFFLLFILKNMNNI